MSFEKLMDQLNGLSSEQETMRKALPAGDGEDDKNIQAAAAEGGGMDKGGKGGDGAAKPVINNDDDDDDDEPLGKSLGEVTLSDGTKMEAVDGTELVKALQEEVRVLGEKHAASETQVLKALETCVSLANGQNELIKSLQGEVAKLRGDGRGRKSALTIIEKPDAGAQLTKSEPATMTGAQFMAKSNAAFEAKKITGVELTTIDVSLRTGQAVDPGLIQKVLS